MVANLRAVQNDAEEIALKSVVFDGHMVGTLFDIDTAVESSHHGFLSRGS